MGVALAVLLVLAIVSEARAAKYSVAQCGWFVGADADWADTTGGTKFRSDAFCVPPPGSDPFDGVHFKSLTREGQVAVTGNRFGRWRWTAPTGTGITKVRASWWHALHDGLEQRIGVVNSGGGFIPFMSAASTDTTPREFVAGFDQPMAALEDRLLCAKAESRSCSLAPQSWSALRALTITLEDPDGPVPAIAGDLVNGGWRRGLQGIVVFGNDAGSGVRSGEPTIDGARVAIVEFPCNKAEIGGEWRATTMRPCLTGVHSGFALDMTNFSDGPHEVAGCVADFAGTSACTAPHPLLIDNNAPAHPRSPQLTGGDGWRRTNDFDLTWSNPDQGQASPIAGARWRLTGPGGFDSGIQFAAGNGLAKLDDLKVPAAGLYSLQVWLRDEAGNEAPPAAVTVPLRFDDIKPKVAFADAGATAVPEQVVGQMSDAHSGPGSGSISFRRPDSAQWVELPTKLVATEPAGSAHLVAAMPKLGLGTYLFKVDAVDAAGNTASSTQRADGTEMAIHVDRIDRVEGPGADARERSRLFARLRGRHGRGETLTVPFGAPAVVGGRLTREDGAGIAGRQLRVIARPVDGALAPVTSATVLTGKRGGFELRLAPGPSRHVSVSFEGDRGIEPASRPPLDLRVRSAVSLRVNPRRARTGQTVHFSGRVKGRGAPMPRRGKLVAIQYFETKTRRWRPVLIAHAAPGGRFHARYRFHYISGAASIRLRASALTEDRWPYAPGSSHPVTVHVSDR
jgi:hypothetical protein